MNDEPNSFLSSSTVSVQVDVCDLKVGMFVCKLDKPWLESPFLFQGFELKNQADIDAVRRECKFVFIDVEKQTRVSKSEHKDTVYLTEHELAKPPPRKTTSFVQEFDHAVYAYRQTSDLVSNFMEDVQFGRVINVAVAKKVIAECVDSVLNAPDALLWMTQLKNRDMYTAQHSMNVCILSIALGKHLNCYTIEDLNNIGLCGMMHDMGKIKIPLDILNKPAQLEPKELKIMQSHAAIGGKLLMASKDMYAGAVDVARSHHERLDGKGYPNGLDSTQITPYSRIVTIADMYDAISSDRVYQRGRTHFETITIMREMIDTQLDKTMTWKFIECIGIYPPGSIVELCSGEVAVVMEVNPLHKLKPKILLLLDENKNRRPLQLVDLFLMNELGTGNRTIKNIVRADKYQIDINEYHELGLIGSNSLSKST